MRERERKHRPDPPMAGGGAEALKLGVVMTPTASEKSGSAKRASGGGKGRRG